MIVWLDLRVHGHTARSRCDLILAGEPVENRSTAHLVVGQIDHLRRARFRLTAFSGQATVGGGPSPGLLLTAL